MSALLSPLRFLLLFLCLSVVLTFFQLSPQAAAQINCVRTKVGNPTGPPPPLPPECENAITGSPNNQSGGRSSLAPIGPKNFVLPFRNANAVTGIATEMASYAGDFSYGGHIEHAGLDIGTAIGKREPIYAVADGTVTAVTLLDGAATCEANNPGCNVVIEHDDGDVSSWYTHIDSSVSVGQKIKQGEQVGVVHIWASPQGNDHLHFELRLLRNNWNINPRNYFPQLNRFPPSDAYVGGVRSFSASRGVYLAEDGKEWAETFRDHPPCLWNLTPGYCWAM